jgi:hypothetical protein
VPFRRSLGIVFTGCRPVPCGLVLLVCSICVVFGSMNDLQLAPTEGWIFKAEVSGQDALEGLMDEEAYVQYCDELDDQ